GSSGEAGEAAAGRVDRRGELPERAPGHRRLAVTSLTAGGTVSRRLRFALLVIVPISALSLCASASAVVTVGSPLAGPFTQGACPSSGGCTIADLALVAPGPPVASPVTGTIIRWRVAGATPLPGYAIRVLGRGAGTMFKGAGSSTPVTPSGGGVETFGADVPIKAGEYVGLNVPEGGGIDGISPGGQYAVLVPGLADGGSANALEQ